MRRITFLIAATCALAPLVALGGIAPSYAGSHASRPHATARPALASFGTICENDSPGYCWRDPSDGGLGTPVVNSVPGTDNAREWGFGQDFSRCQNSTSPDGGFVTNTPPCPFTGGSGLNALFNGLGIYIIENEGSGYCAGSSNADQFKVYMHSCDGVNGVSELASVVVVQFFSDHVRIIPVLDSNLCSCGPEYINGDNHDGDQLTVGSAGTYSRWH